MCISQGEGDGNPLVVERLREIVHGAKEAKSDRWGIGGVERMGSDGGVQKYKNYSMSERHWDSSALFFSRLVLIHLIHNHTRHP